MGASESISLGEVREQVVRSELERLTQSAAFRTSKRCREFLEHIVEHTLSGPSGALKERSIGVELFRLPQDFDTGQHTIVRVTANEVRKRLAQHYLAENGSYHPVRIDLPPGSYSADFRWDPPEADSRAVETPPAEVPPPETQLPARPAWFRYAAIGLTLAVLGFAAAYAVWRSPAAKPVSEDRSVRASGAVALTPPASGDLRLIVGSDHPYV